MDSDIPYSGRRPNEILCNWFLSRVPNDPEVTRHSILECPQWIVLEGERRTVQGTMQLWHSSLIVSRASARDLITATGKVYRIEGPMNLNKMLEFGWTDEVIRPFQEGFPKDWTDILIPFFRIDRKRKAPRQTRPNDPQPNQSEKAIQCAKKDLTQTPVDPSPRRRPGRPPRYPQDVARQTRESPIKPTSEKANVPTEKSIEEPTDEPTKDSPRVALSVQKPVERSGKRSYSLGGDHTLDTPKRGRRKTLGQAQDDQENIPSEGVTLKSPTSGKTGTPKRAPIYYLDEPLTPKQVHNLPTTRSGRRVIPPLEFWRNEYERVDRSGQLKIIYSHDL